MKRYLTIILTCAALLTTSFTASAQFLNSLSLGLGVGVDGASLQVGVPMGSFLQLRAGASYSPPIGYAFPLHNIQFEDGTSGDINLKARLAYNGANAMLDMFPSKTTIFHFTVGVLAGNGKILTVDGTSDALADEDKGSTGIIIGDTLVTTDEKGYCHADLTSRFKVMPYVGIGTGRASNPSRPVSLVFDLGACYCDGVGGFTHGTNMRTGKTDYIQVSSADVNNEDHGILDKISSFPVLPVMKFTLFFKLF